jgi:hypothetical protein
METGARRISAMGDRRTGVMSPQPDHLVRYRDEPRSGRDAHDHIAGDTATPTPRRTPTPVTLRSGDDQGRRRRLVRLARHRLDVRRRLALADGLQALLRQRVVARSGSPSEADDRNLGMHHGSFGERSSTIPGTTTVVSPELLSRGYPNRGCLGWGRARGAALTSGWPRPAGRLASTGASPPPKPAAGTTWAVRPRFW